jgi:drug/metabolite transporter (DMT)-like permease
MSNIVPLTTAVLAFLLLKEKLNALQIFCLLLAFFGVYIQINSTSDNNSGNRLEDEKSMSILPLIVLLSIPLAISGSQLCQRYIRELHCYTAGVYISLVAVIV